MQSGNEQRARRHLDSACGEARSAASMSTCTAQEIAREAWRPMVECRAVSGICEPARLLAVADPLSRLVAAGVLFFMFHTVNPKSKSEILKHKSMKKLFRTLHLKRQTEYPFKKFYPDDCNLC